MGKLTVLLALSGLMFTSCLTVKEYQKVNLNDPDMVLTDKKSGPKPKCDAFLQRGFRRCEWR